MVFLRYYFIGPYAGAGYIGNFMVRELQKKGFEPIIADDLSSGHKGAVAGFELHQMDLATDVEKLDELFSRGDFGGVVHMSSFIQMGESYKNPIKYFENNLRCAENVLSAMEKHSVPY